MKKTIGILGGMGPLATADLYRKIIEHTRADRDNEHIRVYIDGNAAIPDRTAAILHGGEDPVPEMLSALRHLEACGADCIIMPCNTAHYFLPRLQEQTEVPFISMLAETAKSCAKMFPGKTAGIMGTRGTLASGLYNKALEAEGVAYVLPEEPDRDVLMTAIYDCVKGGKDIELVRKPMEGVMEHMRAAGADYFILGCTELPIVAEELKLEGDFIDPTSELAKAAILFCGAELK
jgi:aspartate racemase